MYIDPSRRSVYGWENPPRRNSELAQHVICLGSYAVGLSASHESMAARLSSNLVRAATASFFLPAASSAFSALCAPDGRWCQKVSCVLQGRGHWRMSQPDTV